MQNNKDDQELEGGVGGLIVFAIGGLIYLFLRSW